MLNFRYIRSFGLVLAALIFSASQANAQVANVAIGAHVSTLGVGAELSTKVNTFFVLRGGGNYLQWSTDGTYSGINYDLDVELMSAGGAIDYHPLANGLMISAGVYYNGNGGSLTSSPAGSVTVGGTTYTAAEAGTLKTDVEYNEIAPYIGVGWDSAHYGVLPVSFLARAGLFYMGDAQVSMTSSGTLAGNSAFQSNLAQEQSQLESELSDLGMYWAITIGLKISF